MKFREADLLAQEIHEGQTDKIGVPYIEHVRAVADGVADFPLEVQIAGLLHDAIEDSEWTLGDLRAAGVPEASARWVDALTKRQGESLDRQLARVRCGGHGAALVKISDNAHNSRSDRLAELDAATGDRLAGKYRRARFDLWALVSPRDVRIVVQRVNPALLGLCGR